MLSSLPIFVGCAIKNTTTLCICANIVNLVSTSLIDSNLFPFGNPNLLKAHNDKKILPLLSRLLDIINEKKWEIETKETNLWKVNYKDEINGEISIHSENNKGTIIKITCDKNRTNVV